MIEELIIKNFKSIGEKEQRLSDLGSINVLIGGNNSGKTAVLEMLWIFGELILKIHPDFSNVVSGSLLREGYKFNRDEVLSRAREISLNINSLNDFVHARGPSFQCAFSFSATSKRLSRFMNEYAVGRNDGLRKRVAQDVQQFGKISVRFEINVTTSTIRIIDLRWGALQLSRGDRYINLETYLNTGNPPNYEINDMQSQPYRDFFVPEIQRLINNLKCNYIHSKRRIQEIVQSDQGGPNIKGSILKKELFELFHGESGEREQYNKILEIFKNITKKEVREIPFFDKRNKRVDVVFEENGTRVNIDNAGYGFYQLLNIIYNIVTNDANIILIDEPEISLHPQAQMQLFAAIQRIALDQGKMFIMATHSPYFVDLERMRSIYKVSKVLNIHAEITKVNNPAVLESISEKGEGKFPFRYRELYFMKNVIFVEGLNDLDRLARIIEENGNLELSREYLCQMQGSDLEQINLLGSFCEDLKIQCVFVLDFDVLRKEDKFNNLLEEIKEFNPLVKELLVLDASEDKKTRKSSIREFWKINWKSILGIEEVQRFISLKSKKGCFILPNMDIKEIDTDDDLKSAVLEVLKKISEKFKS